MEPKKQTVDFHSLFFVSVVHIHDFLFALRTGFVEHAPEREFIGIIGGHTFYDEHIVIVDFCHSDMICVCASVFFQCGGEDHNLIAG